MSDLAETTAAAQRANVFDRASLQFTVKLIRGLNPALALRVQNIIAPRDQSFEGYCEAPCADDLFALELDTYTLNRVVDTLADAAQAIARDVLQTQQGNEDFLLRTKDIIGRWFLYARQHQADVERLAARAG